MTNVTEIQSLKFENQKLRSYILLVSAEIQLVERISEIKQNFTNPSDFNRITVPMLDRISKIKSEKKLLEENLNLN